MIDLITVLSTRLEFMQNYIAQGLIPGQLDIYELVHLKGRINELKFMLAMLEEEDVSF